jgi:hypothetical protein
MMRSTTCKCNYNVEIGNIIDNTIHMTTTVLTEPQWCTMTTDLQTSIKGRKALWSLTQGSRSILLHNSKDIDRGKESADLMTTRGKRCDPWLRGAERLDDHKRKRCDPWLRGADQYSCIIVRTLIEDIWKCRLDDHNMKVKTWRQ